MGLSESLNRRGDLVDLHLLRRVLHERGWLVTRELLSEESAAARGLKINALRLYKEGKFEEALDCIGHTLHAEAVRETEFIQSQLSPRRLQAHPDCGRLRGIPAPAW